MIKINSISLFSISILTIALLFGNVATVNADGNSNLSIQKTVHSIGGQTVEFVLKVRSNSPVELKNVIIRDQLSDKFKLIENTTSVNNIVIQGNIVDPGIDIGTLQPGQEAIVRFNATALEKVIPTNDNYVPVTDVKTGAGYNTLITLIGATIFSLLYMRYTQSGFFRLREVG